MLEKVEMLLLLMQSRVRKLPSTDDFDQIIAASVVHLYQEHRNGAIFIIDRHKVKHIVLFSMHGYRLLRSITLIGVIFAVILCLVLSKHYSYKTLLIGLYKPILFPAKLLGFITL